MNLLDRFLDFLHGRDSVRDTSDVPLELPWTRRWHHVAKRSAGPDFRREDYRQARTNAREVARLTLGDALWEQAQRQGYLDIPSKRFPGVTYRIRIGRRVEVRCAPGVRAPWPFVLPRASTRPTRSRTRSSSPTSTSTCAIARTRSSASPPPSPGTRSWGGRSELTGVPAAIWVRGSGHRMRLSAFHGRCVPGD